MALRDILDRLRGRKAPASPQRPPPPARRTEDETILAPPPNAGPAAPPATPVAEAPTVLNPAPSPTPRAQPAAPASSQAETRLGAPVPSPPPSSPSSPPSPLSPPPPGDAAAQSEATVLSPGSPPPSPDAQPTEVGGLPPATPRAPKAPVAPFPRPNPPPSIRPVPRPATAHRLHSDEEVAGVLVGLSGPLHRMALVIPRGRATLGRARDCVLRVDDDNIAERHAELVSAGSQTRVVPLADAPRIEVNGEPVTAEHLLSDGDLVRFGELGASVFRYHGVQALDGSG